MVPAPRFVLTGRLLSPFVRRVAVTLTHLGITFERQVLSTIDDVAQHHWRECLH